MTLRAAGEKLVPSQNSAAENSGPAASGSTAKYTTNSTVPATCSPPVM